MAVPAKVSQLQGKSLKGRQIWRQVLGKAVGETSRWTSTSDSLPYCCQCLRHQGSLYLLKVFPQEPSEEVFGLGLFASG